MCDADDEKATAELAACNAKESSPEEAAEEAGHTEEAAAEEAAARWAPWPPEPLAKEVPSKEPVAPSKVPVATFLIA